MWYLTRLPVNRTCCILSFTKIYWFPKVKPKYFRRQSFVILHDSPFMKTNMHPQHYKVLLSLIFGRQPSLLSNQNFPRNSKVRFETAHAENDVSTVCLQTQLADGHVLAKLANSCSPYLPDPFQYYIVPGRICTFRRFKAEWRSDNSASFFDPSGTSLADRAKVQYKAVTTWSGCSRSFLTIHKRHSFAHIWIDMDTSTVQYH